MVAPIPSQIGSEITQPTISRELQSFYSDNKITKALASHEFQLTYNENQKLILLTSSGKSRSEEIIVASNRDLISLLAMTTPIKMKAVISETHGLVFTANIKNPTVVRIRIISDKLLRLNVPQLAPFENFSLSEKSNPILKAFTNIDSRRATQILSYRPFILEYKGLTEAEYLPKSQTELVRSVVRSWWGIKKASRMLIPDFNAALPRPIAPDALPNAVPITQPIAAELGLKAGQVIQALVGSLGDKKYLQLNNKEIPLPSGTKFPEGLVQIKVMQGREGVSAQLYAPHVTAHSQASTISGMSATLAEVIARPANRAQITSLLAPGVLDSMLDSAGLQEKTLQLANYRLDSNTLNAQMIARAVQFGGLNTERALMEGIALSSQTLKPWLRQILRLLPAQSNLSSRIGDLIGDLESFQLDVIPNNVGREQQSLSAILLFRDQEPVELSFEYSNQIDGADSPVWIINLHTSIERLGEIWLKSTFRDSMVDAVMWAREAQTANLAKKSVIDLREAFSELGLTIKSLQILNAVRSDYTEKNSVSSLNLDLEA